MNTHCLDKLGFGMIFIFFLFFSLFSKLDLYYCNNQKGNNERPSLALLPSFLPFFLFLSFLLFLSFFSFFLPPSFSQSVFFPSFLPSPCVYSALYNYRVPSLNMRSPNSNYTLSCIFVSFCLTPTSDPWCDHELSFCLTVQRNGSSETQPPYLTAADWV